MAKTVIRFTLDETEIDKAIQKVKSYKTTFLNKCGKLVEVLTQEGAEIAKVQVAQLDAVYTGELMNSIDGYFDSTTGVGIIRADAYYAIYVEFGTGVVGKQSPHPNPNGWQYDVNNHGDKGWVYYDDENDKFRWTKGFKSRPFMYNTARQLEKECARIAREVFGK
jgi:HK97 gp10 family phage protein